MSRATVFYDVAEAARSCVCDQMDALAAELQDYPGCPCSTFVSAGEPALDCCEQHHCKGPHGLLTAHVEQVFPSDSFPNATATFLPCKAATWVASLVITAARCAPTMDNHGNPRSSDEMSASALLMAIDQYAIVTALSCCLVEDGVSNKRNRRVQIAGSRPLVTSGGCAAVEIRAFVEAGQVCSCVENTS